MTSKPGSASNLEIKAWNEHGALRRGLHIMRALTGADDRGLKVAEIAEITGLPRPTVYRLLKVLLDEGFVREGTHNKRFVNAQSVPDQVSADRLVAYYAGALRNIAAQTGNSVFLVRRLGDDSLCIHREFGDYPIQVVATKIGGRVPLGVGAAGLALIIGQSNSELEEIFRRLEPRLKDYGGMVIRTLSQLVRSSQVRGYTVVGNYAVQGVLGVGVPVRDKVGRTLAAISVSSTLERMSPSRQAAIAQLIEMEIDRIQMSLVC